MIYIGQFRSETGPLANSRLMDGLVFLCGPHCSSIMNGQSSHPVCRNMVKKYSHACRAWSRFRHALIYVIFSAWLEYTHDDVCGAAAPTRLAYQEQHLSFLSEFSEAPDPSVRQPVHWTLTWLMRVTLK